MRKNNVEVPQALLDQRTFAKEVSENNQRILEHVDFLRTLAQNLHQMHTQLSKSITELTDSAEKKVSHLKDDNS